MPSSFGCGLSHRFSTVDNIDLLHLWQLFADAVAVYVFNGVEAFLLLRLPTHSCRTAVFAANPIAPRCQPVNLPGCGTTSAYPVITEGVCNSVHKLDIPIRSLGQRPVSPLWWQHPILWQSCCPARAARLLGRRAFPLPL